METLRGFPNLPAMVRGRQAGQLPTRPQTVRWPFPDSLIARARTLAPRVYAATESTPALLHAELGLVVSQRSDSASPARGPLRGVSWTAAALSLKPEVFG
jgi:hypothetical protein